MKRSLCTIHEITQLIPGTHELPILSRLKKDLLQNIEGKQEGKIVEKISKGGDVCTSKANVEMTRCRT
jgi:hypothetical protein